VDVHFYRFRTTWHLDAPLGDAYTALECLDDYPTWWHEVTRADRVDDETYDLGVRSTLPYELRFTTRQRRRDPEAGVLEAELAGDLSGFSRWTITPEGAGTVAVFEEEVTVNKALLRRLAYVARPAFQANHAVMMRSGRRGLAAYLAGFRRGRTST
jgi:hypothetical protein